MDNKFATLAEACPQRAKNSQKQPKTAKNANASTECGFLALKMPMGCHLGHACKVSRAGSKKILHMHGSLESAYCMYCNQKVILNFIKILFFKFHQNQTQNFFDLEGSPL